jgi:cob(I)alamin adenosyltransferase
MKITKVYTKTGDKGDTSLVGGIRIKKTDVRIEAYGTVDELNSSIGLLITYLENNDDITNAERIQNDLFVIASYLATDTTKTELYAGSKLDEKEIGFLETSIDDILNLIPPQTSFVLPGGCRAAAVAHVSRTICRRTERCVLRLSEETPIDAHILSFINRLSDYLFVLARKLNFISNTSEKIWHNTCR